MSGHTKNQITCVIKNVFWEYGKCFYSHPFEFAGCDWRVACRLASIHKEDMDDDGYLSLYLELAPVTLPPGWRRDVKYSLSLVKQSLKKTLGGKGCFDAENNSWGIEKFLPVGKLWRYREYYKLTIIAELDVIPPIVVIPEEPVNIIIKEIQPVKETTDVNGFEVLSSQVESMKLIFERHPDIAVGFNAKNQCLRNACMNFLLSLVETLCQSLEKLSIEDLVEADIALTYLKDAGFKVDWLEKKLDQLKDKKKKEKSCLAWLQEIEKHLQKLKQKCSELQTLAEEEKADLSAIRTALSFDDLV